MSKVIVGLDIGTTKIACFVGRKNEHGKIEILSMGKTESIRGFAPVPCRVSVIFRQAFLEVSGV